MSLHLHARITCRIEQVDELGIDPVFKRFETTPGRVLLGSEVLPLNAQGSASTSINRLASEKA